MIKLYPSAELHLLRGQSVELELFMNDPGTNAWTRVDNPLALAQSVSLATLSGRSLTASSSAMGTNIDFLTVQDSEGHDIIKVPLQVSVYDTVQRVHCSHARHEVEVTSSDRVLVVYAEFVDAAGSVVVADVTGSNLLHYDVSPAGGLAVTNGRLEVPATPGTWTVTVMVHPSFGVTPTPVSASVVIHSVPVASEYPILVRHHAGTEARRRAILFIAEGWTADMEAMFHDLCKVVAKRLMRVRPYRHLAESLDVYAAFTASAEEGITVGADVVVSPVHPDHAYVLMRDGSPLFDAINAVGLPNEPGAPTTLAELRASSQIPSLTPREFDIWNLIPSAQRTRVRDTAWGVAITYPQHGPHTHARSADATKPSRLALSVLPRGPARAPYFADHRLPELRGASPQDPTTAHVARLYDFVGKLRTPDGPAGMGKRWQPDGDSAGLVVFIARSDLQGGIFLEGDQGCVIVTTGREADAGVSPSSIPGFKDVIPGRTSSIGDPETRRRLVDTIAHELAHVPALGGLHDEYGGRRMGNNPPPWIAPYVNGKANAHMLADVLDGQGPGIDPLKLKWRWPRARAGASVKEIVTDGLDIVFTLTLTHALRWPRSPAGHPVWLRRGPLWPQAALVPPVVANPVVLELVSYDRQQQQVRCRPVGTLSAADIVASFGGASGQADPPADVRIVLQRVDVNGGPMWLISDAVAAALAAGPLTESLACEDAIGADRRSNVVGLRTRTPAAYEGGATFNCKTIRPGLECKMHRQMEPIGVGKHRTLWVEKFCVVCQYVITYQGDVSMLPSVDRQLDVVETL